MGQFFPLLYNLVTSDSRNRGDPGDSVLYLVCSKSINNKRPFFSQHITMSVKFLLKCFSTINGIVGMCQVTCLVSGNTLSVCTDWGEHLHEEPDSRSGYCKSSSIL